MLQGGVRFRQLLGLALSVFLVSCGGAPAAPLVQAGAAGAELPLIDPATVSGAIAITGSSTVYPLTAAVAEAFAAEGSPTHISIQSTGTGGGFKRFCDPENDIDVVNASRAVTDEEIALCQQGNRPPVGFRVGTDALAIVVHPQNTFVQSLSYAQLAQIFSGQARTWQQIDPNYPAEPIALFSPGTDSGTFDYFVENVFDGDSQPLVNAGATLSEDDKLLADGVAANPFAIGYFGFAYYQENQGVLRVVPIDGGSGAVTPSADTVADGSYPMARPLYVYTTAQILKDEPAVAAFIAYYLQTVNELIGTVGYFPASDQALDESRQALLSALAS